MIISKLSEKIFILEIQIYFGKLSEKAYFLQIWLHAVRDLQSNCEQGLNEGSLCFCSRYYNGDSALTVATNPKGVITWSRFAGMKFCPTLPGSRQYSKLFINFILWLHGKSFIPARRDPAFVLPGSHFAGTKFPM